MNMYIVGTVVEMAGVFEDLDGIPADPTFVRATIILPDGSLINLTDGVQRRDIGAYFVLYVPPISGLYQYRLIGYGAIAAANEGCWYAETSFPYDAINIPNTGELDMFDGAAPIINPTLSVFSLPLAGGLNVVGYVPGTGQLVVQPDTGGLAAVGQLVQRDADLRLVPNTGSVGFQGVQAVTGENVLTGVGTSAFAGIAPVISNQFVLVPLSGGLNIAGATPSLNGQPQITPNAAVMALTGISPPLATKETINPASLALVGVAPVLLTNFIFGNTTTPGQLTLTGQQPVLSIMQLMPTQQGAIVFANGAAPSVLVSSPRNPNAGTGDFVGNAPVIQYTASIAVPAGAVAFTGNTVGVSISRMPLVGALTLAGVAGALVRGNVITPPAGSLLFAGPIVPIQGIYFRLTNNQVNPTNFDVEANSAGFNYPHTSAQGVSVGWETANGSLDYNNRDVTADVRLKGTAFWARASFNDYRIDLPAPGVYNIRLAMGDSFLHAQRMRILDTLTVKSDIDSGDVPANQWVDATGVIRTSEANFVANNAPLQITFATTICRFRIGASATASADPNTCINFVYIERVS